MIRPLKFASVLTLAFLPVLLQADDFKQINLVSDVSGLATYTDPNLINPWGVAFSPTSPFWVSNQGSGTSTLYNGLGVANSLVVSVPGASTGPTGPTGQVYNGNSAEFGGAKFIFDTLNGTIAAWSSGTSAVTSASVPGAVFTGLAIGNNGTSDFLYAADSKNGKIDVFNTSFGTAMLSGNFVDPNGLAGYVPFNIQELNGQLYVTYARLTANGSALPGGYIDVFDNNGDFIKRLTTGGSLYAPWGITIAPVGFSNLGGDFLVGNFGGAGNILEYDANGNYLGMLDGPNGQPIADSGLWALEFRTGGTGVNTEALYFTAGINNQQDGLFGEIVEAPEPAPLYTLLGSAIFAGVFLRRRLSTR